MIKSMTGFGRGIFQDSTKELLVEIKSVNHRYCDVSIKMPRQIFFLEEKVREAVAKNISRGKVDIFVSYKDYGDPLNTVLLDEMIAKGYIDAVNALRDKYSLKDDISVSLIAQFPDVVKLEKCEQDEAKLWEMLSLALQEAISGLVVMRAKEGVGLYDDLVEKIKYMEQLLKDIESFGFNIVKEYKIKLEARIKELLEKQNVDEDRIAMEAAIFADRSCIDEELVRLKSHIQQFNEVLDVSQPVGRKLDFIVQEMNREINTIGSKANNIHISKLVIELKSELEKIREQVQNIE